MTGRKMEELRDALCAAFDQESLDQMLRLRLGKDRAHLVGSGNLQAVVFKLINVAVREGWQSDLIRAALACNPGSPALQRFLEKHGDLTANEEPSAAGRPVSVISPTTTPPAALVVSSRGDGQFRTISEAVRAAEPGTQIRVRPGLYREDVTLAKPVEIIGDGQREEIVVENPDNGQSCLVIESYGVTVRGLSFRQTRQQRWWHLLIKAVVPAVYIDRGQALLEDCDITSQDDGSCLHIGGQLAEDAATPLRVSATIRNCRIHDSKGIGVTILDQVILDRCDISGHAKAGVVVSGIDASGTLGHCRINHNALQAIQVSERAQATVEDCDLSGNQQGAWQIAPDSTVHRNRNRE
jgi:pectin methylesterase-like acyl-CoA thioesterase